MNEHLCDIDRQIEELIAANTDPETGELLIEDAALDALQMEREAKIENLALFIKNCAALAADIRDEENALAERRKSLERKVDRLKKYLESVLGGQKFQTAKCFCIFRKSESVEISPEFISEFTVWAKDYMPELLRMKDPEPDKTAIKKLLKSGEEIPFAELVTKQSITIK